MALGSNYHQPTRDNNQSDSMVLDNQRSIGHQQEQTYEGGAVQGGGKLEVAAHGHQGAALSKQLDETIVQLIGQRRLSSSSSAPNGGPRASTADLEDRAASQTLESATNSMSSSNPICQQQQSQQLLIGYTNDNLNSPQGLGHYPARDHQSSSYYNHHQFGIKSFKYNNDNLGTSISKHQAYDHHQQRSSSEGRSSVDGTSSLASCEGPRRSTHWRLRARRLALLTMQLVTFFLILDLLVYYWPMDEPSIEAPKVATYRPRPSYSSLPWLSNEILDDSGESLFLGQFNAPESMAWTADRRAFYTGVEGGFILLVEPYENRWSVVARLNARGLVRDRSVEGAANETQWVPFCKLDTELYGPRAEFEPQLIIISRCSRPLGIRLHPSGSHLYVSDPLSGLYRIEVPVQGESRPLLRHPSTRLLAFGSGAAPAPGVGDILFADDIAVDWAPTTGSELQDLIYLTDCSRRWTLRFLVRLMAENDDSGRVLEIAAEPDGVVAPIRELQVTPTHDPMTQDLDFRNLSFPNGVELSANGSALLVADLNNRRLLMRHLRGPLAGQTRLVLWTPGYPDNIRRGLDLPDGRPSYWVACGCAVGDGYFEVAEFMNDYPKLRRLLLRWIHFLGVAIDWLGRQLDSTTLRDAGLIVNAGWLKVDPYCTHGLVFQFTEDGHVVRTLQTTSFSSKFKLLSEAHEVPLWDGASDVGPTVGGAGGLFAPSNRSALYLGSVYNSYLGRVEL